MDGRLFGHLFLGRDLVRDAAREQGDVNPELLRLLEHLIVTHLNLPEWGSPRLPLIPEVLILHHADDLDAKMEMYVRCLTRRPGAGPFTERDPASAGSCSRGARYVNCEDDTMTLNESAMALCRHPGRERRRRGGVPSRPSAGPGSSTAAGRSIGGLQAGLQLARVCTAGLADVVASTRGRTGRSSRSRPTTRCGPAWPSQYAGWQIKVGKFFAMGSGPMRAAAGKEALFDHIPGREQPPCAVGVLETRKHPTEEVIAYLVEQAADHGREAHAARSPRRRAWPARCRSWPAVWRRPCTSCTS